MDMTEVEMLEFNLKVVLHNHKGEVIIEATTNEDGSVTRSELTLGRALEMVLTSNLLPSEKFLRFHSFQLAKRLKDKTTITLTGEEKSLIYQITQYAKLTTPAEGSFIEIMFNGKNV